MELSGANPLQLCPTPTLKANDFYFLGSERSGAAGTKGERFKEGCMINTSLFTLGKVIAELSEGK